MKLLRYTKNSAKILCMAFLLNACAGDDSVEDPVSGDGANAAENSNDAGFNEDSGNSNENGNSANNENGNAGNNGNNLLNNENLGAGAGDGKQANEFLNNAAGENFLGNEGAGAPATDAPADLSAQENSTEDLGIKSGNDIVGNQDQGAPMKAAPPNANMGATDASLARKSSGGTVHYVLKDGTSAYDRPSGQVVKNFEQGDHPVVSPDGEWVRTSDGMYVSTSSVTTRPIPRSKMPKPWR